MALASVLDSYTSVIEQAVHTAGRTYDIVNGRWTGRAAEFARDAVDNWQGLALSGAGELQYIAGRLRRAAVELEADIAAWHRRVDAYAEAVREKGRWGPR